jgi:cyclic beta-1,2-glucan synthetase
MYRAGTEWFLGLRKQGNALRIEPCIPRHWSGFDASLRHGSARYEIRVDNPAGVSRGVSRIEVDGASIEDGFVTLVDDGRAHSVKVTLGARH